MIAHKSVGHTALHRGICHIFQNNCKQATGTGDMVLAAIGTYSSSLNKSLDPMKNFTSKRTGPEKSDI